MTSPARLTYPFEEGEHFFYRQQTFGHGVDILSR